MNENTELKESSVKDLLEEYAILYGWLLEIVFDSDYAEYSREQEWRDRQSAILNEIERRIGEEE